MGKGSDFDLLIVLTNRSISRSLAGSSQGLGKVCQDIAQDGRGPSQHDYYLTLPAQ